MLRQDGLAEQPGADNARPSPCMVRTFLNDNSGLVQFMDPVESRITGAILLSY